MKISLGSSVVGVALFGLLATVALPAQEWDYTWQVGQPVARHLHDRDAVAVFAEGARGYALHHAGHHGFRGSDRGQAPSRHHRAEVAAVEPSAGQSE